MTHYWVSFRIADNATYNKRYGEFIDAVNECGTGFWEGPTSFIAIISGLDIDILGAALKATLDPRVDMFVLREIGRDNTRHCGTMGEGFEAFFPKSKKL